MNIQCTPECGQEVRVSRSLPGPIERVWAYLTDAELLEKWLAVGEVGPVGSPLHLDQTADPVPWKKAGYLRGVVVQNEAPHKLAYTIKRISCGRTEQELEDSLVEFLLEGGESEVTLRIHHSRLRKEELAWIFAEWNAHLEFLVDSLDQEDKYQTRSSS